ncbi:TPA: anthrax toxin-like adenylyl cyclase domain-containing protein [Proteus mirabilis]
MNKHETIILNINLDSLAKKIKMYIENNMIDNSIDYHKIKNLLLEKYLILSIHKNEYIAKDYLSEIEEGLDIYDRNKETKKMLFIKKKLDKNIELFIKEIETEKIKNKVTITKGALELFFKSNEYSIYDLDFFGAKFFIYIDNEKNKYEIISFNQKKRSFNNKKLLLDYLFNNINHINEKIQVRLTAYKKKEFTLLANNIEKWGINESFLSEQIIKSIKLKEIVKVNDDFSIKLVESYDYKKIFLLKNNKDNSEVIVHIYTDNIENAISLLTESYSKIKNKSESLVYQKNNKWVVEKRNKGGEVFIQGKDFILPLANILERINISSSSYTGKLLDNMMGGFCYGLSLRYLIEVRNRGIEGAENYLKWLKKFAKLYRNKPSDQKEGGFKEKIKRAIYEYNLMELTDETQKIIIAHNYQQERIKGRKYLYHSQNGQIPYSNVLNGMGLAPINNERILLSEELFFEKIDGLLTGNNNRYIFIEYKEHLTAITYKRYSDGKYKITFFEPRFGTFELDNIEDLKNIIREKKNHYGLYEQKGTLCYGFDEFTEVNSESYKPLFSNQKSSKAREIFRNKGIAEKLKTVDFSLEFSKDVTGRVMHYDEKGILIVQIKHNNKLIDISVVEDLVEDGLYLIKDNINKIIELENVSNIILKNVNGNIAITPIGFNTVWAESRSVGYVEFDHNNYIFNIFDSSNKINSMVKKDFEKIKKLINKLNTNIYFEKINTALELINTISKFTNQYKDESINNKLMEISNDIENRLFYGELGGEKSKIIALAEKNSTIATKLYQSMVNEINNGNTNSIKFIYDKIINHKFLIDDTRRPQGIAGYDYTILLDNNEINILEIINKIDTNQLKNMIYYDGNNQIHLRLTYNELMIFKDNNGVKELLLIIDKEIDKHRKNNNETNQDIFTKIFINNEYVNRVLLLEFNELNNFALTTEDQLIRQDTSQYPYFDSTVSESTIKELVIENIKKTGIGYILFENNEDNIKFIIDNSSILKSNAKKIVTDLIPQIYQVDLNNYLQGIKNNGRITHLLKDNENLKKLVDLCAKNNISIIAAGENNIYGIHNEFIDKNIKIKNFHDIIRDNTVTGEGVLIIADKTKLYNFRNGIIYVEGLSSKLNTPIFNIKNNQIRRSENDTIYTDSLVHNEYVAREKNDVIVAEYVHYDPVIAEKNDSIKIKEYFSNIIYSNKIYNEISRLYPSFRRDKKFLLGYKNDIKTAISNYSPEMKTKEILEFIILNKYNLTMEKLGAIVREIDLRTYQLGIKAKQNKSFTQLFDKVNRKEGIDKKATLSFFPQQQLLLNLKDGVEGRCESLTMLMLVAKYLEHTGDVGRCKIFINNLILAQSVLNKGIYDEYKLKHFSKELIFSLNELSKNHLNISNTVGNINNNKRTLNYVINKLTNKKLNSDSCYLQLYTSDHVITVWAKLEKNNNNFGMYDPNFGIVEFSSKRKFIAYLNDFFKSSEINAGKLYGLEKNIKNDFIFNKVLDVNVRSLSEITLNNKRLGDIVSSNIINYQGVHVDLHENVYFGNNIKYKESIINSKKREGKLLTINSSEVAGYYSFADKKIATSRKVVLLITEDNDLNSHYLNFSQEYHKAGYDLFIVDSSTSVDAGRKAYDYLIRNLNVDTNAILLHGHNRSGEKVFDLYQSLNKRGYFPEGIVLSSSNNDLISVVDKVNELNYKTNIYIAHDHQITDENNFLINRILKSFGHKVKKFSFSHREEYDCFSDARYRPQDPTRKFSSYQSRNLVLAPIENEPAPVLGMPDNDQKIFRQIANSENVIVGVRPIDTRSTTLIMSKQYSSKGLLIKGKSSDWGPMAGFIPVDQSLAKSSARNNVTKYNLANQESLDKGHAIAIPLILSSDRVRELHKNNILQLPELLTDIIKVTCSVENRDYDFYLSKSNQSGETVYTVNYYDNGKLVPVHVLGDPISKKPMIADYDLFTVMYSYNDLSEKTMVKKPLSWEEWKNTVNYNELLPACKQYYTDKDLYDRYEGEQLGLISAHVKKVKDKINTSLQRGKGKEMIHHGADDANPFSVITDNFPATFFVPDELLNKALNSDNNTLKDFFIVNENNTIIIRNVKEFSDFQQLVINNGYISPLNERWNDGIQDNSFSKKRKNSEKFINNRELIDQRFSSRYKNSYQSSLDNINKKYFNRVFELIKNNNFKNIVYTNSEQVREEIELLRSPYQHEEDIKNHMDGDGVYNKFSIRLKKLINQYKSDLDWFKKGGYKIFNFISSSSGNYLNRSDSSRLNNIFNIILDLPEIKEAIYKSIYIDNLSSYTNNIDTGSVIAINNVLIGSRNVQKIKQNKNNVFISIVGEHNARTMTGISNRFTDQVMVAPGKHFRVVSQRKENNKLYLVLEATDILVKKEPVFDLYNGHLKGFAIDTHRSTVTESLETVISDKRLLDTINKVNNEYIDTAIESNFIDKIINKKLTPEYAEYRYYDELSKVFGTGKNYVEILNQIINDPLSNKKYNQYVNNKISREEWLESFSHHYYSHDLLNEKISNIKILVEAINDMPSCINRLSNASKSILMEFFSCDFNSLTGKLLRIVSNQESYDGFIDIIERMKFYATQETNFKGDTIHDVFYKVLRTENNKEKYKNVLLDLKKKLLKSRLNNNKYETSILRLPFEFNNEMSSLLTFLYCGLNKEMNHDMLMEHIRLLEVLYKKLSLNHYLLIFLTKK